MVLAIGKNGSEVIKVVVRARESVYIDIASIYIRTRFVGDNPSIPVDCYISKTFVTNTYFIIIVYIKIYSLATTE